jgi:hypothetical protein
LSTFFQPYFSCYPHVPALHTTWWHIAEVAASQHFINASNGCKNSKIFIPRGKAAILAICSLAAMAGQHHRKKTKNKKMKDIYYYFSSFLSESTER